MSALLTLIIPFMVPRMAALAQRPALVQLAASSTNGRPVPVFFESVVHVKTDDMNSPIEGRGRFHAELYLLHLGGCDLARWPASARFAARFFVSGLLPFVFLIGVSLCTAGAPRALVDRFYGKMKTPVGATPELEAAAMAETARDPLRFESTKLFPSSSLELTKWNREDAVGFGVCCVISGAILGLFMLVLRAAAGT